MNQVSFQRLAFKQHSGNNEQ